MDAARFNNLLNGPLRGPIPILTITRLATALHHVVEATGEAGEKALDDYCATRELRDNEADT